MNKILLALCLVSVVPAVLVWAQDASRIVDPFSLGVVPQVEPFLSHRDPMKNAMCKNTPWSYDPLAVYDERFIVPDTDLVNFNHDRSTKGSWFNRTWHTTFQHQNRMKMPPHEDALRWFQNIFFSLGGLNGKFEQCFSAKTKPFSPPETAKYIAHPVCLAKPISIHKRAVYHSFRGRTLKCFIPNPFELFSVRCSNPADETDTRCKLGYDGFNHYRCVPTNFVQRRVNIVCPDVHLMFSKYYSVPTACSCKMCFKCSNGVSYDLTPFDGSNGRFSMRGELNGRMMMTPTDGIPFYAKSGLQK